MGLATITTPAATPRKWAVKPNPQPDPTVFFHNLDERNRILVQHLPQVHYIAGRIHNRLPQHVPLDDLVQAGVLGLMEALHKFDPSKNVQLQSYAKMRIRGAILDSLRELDWSPRTLRRRARQIESAHQALRTRFGRAPSDNELASEIGLSLRKYQHLLGDIHGLEIVSLQALGAEDGYGDEGSRHLPPSRAEDPSSSCLAAEMNELLARAMGELAPRKREILVLYYFEELTMKEVGSRLGLGESRVSQIHTATLSRLRTRLRQLLESRSRMIRSGGKEILTMASKRPLNPGPLSSLAAPATTTPPDWGVTTASPRLPHPLSRPHPRRASPVENYPGWPTASASYAQPEAATPANVENGLDNGSGQAKVRQLPLWVEKNEWKHRPLISPTIPWPGLHPVTVEAASRPEGQKPLRLIELGETARAKRVGRGARAAPA